MELFPPFGEIWEKAKSSWRVALTLFVGWFLYEVIIHAFFSWFNEHLWQWLGHMNITSIIIRWTGDNPIQFLIILAVFYCLFVIIGAQFKKTVPSEPIAEKEPIKPEKLENDFMSLKEACDRLIEEKYNIFGPSISDAFDKLYPNKQYLECARYFAEVDTIYGNSPSQFFKEHRPISNDKFTLGYIKFEQGELVLYGPGNYVGKTPEYIALAIKATNLIQDIKAIIESMVVPLSTAIQYLYDECDQNPILKKYIKEQLGGDYKSRNEIWNDLADHFVEYTIISFYGKGKYSTEFRKIHIRNHLGNYEFYDEASSVSLYDVNEQYTNISIDKRFVRGTIEMIKQRMISIITET